MLAAPPSKVSIAVLAGLALTGALAGCSAAEDAGTDAGTSDSGTSDSGTADTSAVYTDGTYTAEGSYQAPSGTESVDVTISEHAGGDWELVKQSHPSEKKDATTFEFTVRCAPEKPVTTALPLATMPAGGDACARAAP